MPGRLRTMIKRVQALYDAAVALNDALEEVRPQQCRDRGNTPRDQLGQAWFDAGFTVFEVRGALCHLLNCLSRKAARKGKDVGAEVADILGTPLDDEPEDPKEAAETDGQPTSAVSEP